MIANAIASRKVKVDRVTQHEEGSVIYGLSVECLAIDRSAVRDGQ